MVSVEQEAAAPERTTKIDETRLRRVSQIQGNRASSGYVPPEREDPYQSWCKNNYLTHRDIKELSCLVENALEKLPTISIVMPVFNPPRQFFEEAIESVRKQIYSNWELCIADDASSESWVWPRLQELAVQDGRIKTTRRNLNGNISLASNSAATLATGDFLLFFDQDDLLSCNATAEVALATLKFSDTDIVYSDDDKIDGDGRRFAPQFKPDWSPELLLSYMYFSHLFCVRRDLFNECCGFRLGFEGSQDYDLALRVTEKARKVIHLPKCYITGGCCPDQPRWATQNLKVLRLAAGLLKGVKQAIQ